MALISLRQMLDHAAEHNYGVPAFNVNNLEQMRAIMMAADQTDSPVIVQASAGARKYAGAPFLRHLIQAAVEDTRDLDYHLIDAQETRRVLDRLYGYRLSPVLWKKVMPRISAGRVQSVATRLIVEKERERMAFISSSWWDLNASCELGFTARLLSVEGKKVADATLGKGRGNASL